jgi:hypothetical protein
MAGPPFGASRERTEKDGRDVCAQAGLEVDSLETAYDARDEPHRGKEAPSQ